MRYSHNAFTMIELIFVIVILGILAAVAIPKLAATRTDAEISKIATNIMQGASEIASYAVSQARTEDNLSTMAQGIASLESTGEATIDTTNKKATVSYGGVSDCVTIQIATGVEDENLSISLADAGTHANCAQLQSAIDAGKYPMKLRGTSVAY